MSYKKIKNGQEVKDSLSKGINAVANVVRTTLGPVGKNVIIETQYGPIVTVDGVSVAKEIVLEDSFENQGAQLCIEVASKTNDVAGDGTTTATVLAQAMVNEGLKYTIAGGNPLSVKKGMEKALNNAIDIITSLSIPINTKEQTKHIATISGKDSEIGVMISDAIDKVGKNGIITTEESVNRTTHLQLQDGFRIDNGWANHFFINNP
jgi:chaperonin GroEL